MVMLVTIIDISNVGIFISQPDSHWGYHWHTEARKVICCMMRPVLGRRLSDSSTLLALFSSSAILNY
jgi:hypothetical protein